MSIPKVSISLISYNHEMYIAKAIESVLCQKTDFAFEIVISNDASTDGTGAIIEEYAEKYPEIIRFKNRTENLGLVKNAMQTISDCSGEYIALLEGDDYWADDLKLQKQCDFLDSNRDCSFCFTNGIVFWEGTDKEELGVNTPLPAKFDLNFFLQRNVSILNNTKMFRNSVHPHNLPDWFYCTVQWDWSLHVLHSKHGMIGYMDFIGMYYRRHEKAFIISTDTVSLIKSGLRTMDGLNRLLDYKYDFFFSEKWWHYEELAKAYLKKGNVILFLLYLAKTIGAKPNRTFQGYRDLLWKIRN